MFARHLLAFRKQQPSESVDLFLQSLKLSSKDCGFQAVSANVYAQESTPGAKLRYARDAEDERWRCLLREYSHWKRYRQALFSNKCHIIQWLQPWETVLHSFLRRRKENYYYC